MRVSVRSAVTLLRQTPGVDAKRVYVLGHSLGAMAAPKMAATDPKIAGIVIMAGAALSPALAPAGSSPRVVMSVEPLDELPQLAGRVKAAAHGEHHRRGRWRRPL